MFLLFLGCRLFPDLLQESVFKLFELPIIRIGEDFRGYGNIFCRGQDHQRISPLVNTVLHKADVFPKMPPPLAAAAVKLCIQCAAFFCPIKQHSGAFPAGSVPAKLRIDAVFHDEALAVLGSEEHGHGKSDIPSVPPEEQEEAAILRSAVNFHHAVMIPGAEKVFKFVVIGVGENVPLVIGMKLLPKGSNIVFRDCFTDGDSVFHLVSSK